MPLNAPAPMAPAPFARASRRVLGPPRINSPPLSCQPMQGQGAQMRPAASSPLALPGVGSPPWGVKMSRPRRGWRISLGLSPRYSASRAIHLKRLRRQKILFFLPPPAFPPSRPLRGLAPPGGLFIPAGGVKRGYARLFALTQRPASGCGATAFYRSGFPGPGGFRSPVPGPRSRAGAANRGRVCAG